jgi:6-pyruvoyltetrahydropterin/6-carboxytetrahydropterin synthase
MPSATISKSFEFHAAHQLPNHGGACRELHGHTYRLRVEVSGKIKPANGAPDEGMVLDFSAIKRCYRDWVEPLVEHRFLNETLRDVVEVTTAENLAVWMQGVFEDRLGRACSIELWETPSSSVRVP